MFPPFFEVNFVKKSFVFCVYREKLKRKLEESGGMSFPVDDHFSATLDMYGQQEHISTTSSRRKGSIGNISSSGVNAMGALGGGSGAMEANRNKRSTVNEEVLEERERKRIERELRKEMKAQEKERKKENSQRGSRGRSDSQDMSGGGGGGNRRDTRSPDRRGSSSSANAYYSGGGQSSDGQKPPKLRQKKRMDPDEGYDNDSRNDTPGHDFDATGSIIKRRKRGELQISIDGGGHQITSDMGPPDDTPGARYRLRSVGPLTSMLGALESPFGGLDTSLSILGGLDKHAMFSDPFSAETPGKYFDVPLSKPMSTLTSDSLRFDFDEVVQHFPSPKTGEKLGSSPMRWAYGLPGSAESKAGQSVFTFPDAPGSSLYSNYGVRSSGAGVGVGTDEDASHAVCHHVLRVVVL